LHTIAVTPIGTGDIIDNPDAFHSHKINLCTSGECWGGELEMKIYFTADIASKCTETVFLSALNIVRSEDNAFKMIDSESIDTCMSECLQTKGCGVSENIVLHIHTHFRQCRTILLLTSSSVGFIQYHFLQMPKLMKDLVLLL
jgi:hypothetical protein